MKMKIDLKGKSYEVEISNADEGKIKVKVGDKEFVFNDDTQLAGPEKPRIAQAYLPQKKDFKEKEIKSPIAGIVSEIFVKEGDKVKGGDKILLLSAMKMENEIVSEQEGKVKEVKVKKNQQVGSGAILIVLD